MHDTKYTLQIKTTTHQNWVPLADAQLPYTQYQRRGCGWPAEGQRCHTLAGMDKLSKLWPCLSRSLTAVPALDARRLPSTVLSGISIQQSMPPCPLIANAEEVSTQEKKNESGIFTPLLQTSSLE